MVIIKNIKKKIPQYIKQWLKYNIISVWFTNLIWAIKGKPIPPYHAIKQLTVKEYKDKYKFLTLIETGTYLGDMVFAMKKYFNRIYSIEIDNDLYLIAKNRFKNQKNVKILNGDSGVLLGNIIKELNEPVIFWLDGHYSGGITAKGKKITPIMEELNHILNSNIDYAILIDDARCFNGENDYPTLKEVTEFIKSRNRNYDIEVKNDIIRITPD